MSNSSIDLVNKSTYLISVKPQWAELFFDTDRPKTVELRKGNFGKSLVPGDQIFIYATLPVGEIIGLVTVKNRRKLVLDDLYYATEEQTGLLDDEFHTYYAYPIDSGVAVWVESPKLLDEPIALADLKAAGINPPQQIVKLSQEQLDRLLFQNKGALVA